MELYQRIAQGEQEAFAAVHHLYKTRLFYYARRLLKEWHDVDDLVADTFMALWLSRAQMRSDEHLRNFLFLTLRNKALNKLKANNRQTKNAEHLEVPEETYDNALEIEMVQAAMMRQIYEAVSRLPDNYRRIIELSYDQQRSSDEIAQILQMNPATVRSQKRRAFEMIRKWVKDKSMLILLIIILLLGYLINFKKSSTISGTNEYPGCI